MFEELQVMTAYPFSNNIFKLLEEKSISLGRRASQYAWQEIFISNKY